MRKWTSFVVVAISAEHIEAKQYWTTDSALIGDCIADTIKRFSTQHGGVVEEIVVRPIYD